MICKEHIRGKCMKERCADIHDKSMYPCPSLFGLGFCEKQKDCKFSHQPIKLERDIEEFIIDNEHYLVDIYKSRRETALGYYFIKYLARMKEKNWKRFENLNVQLPHQMPPFISPRLLIPKNNYQRMNSTKYLSAQQRNNTLNHGYKSIYPQIVNIRSNKKMMGKSMFRENIHTLHQYNLVNPYQKNIMVVKNKMPIPKMPSQMQMSVMQYPMFNKHKLGYNNKTINYGIHSNIPQMKPDIYKKIPLIDNLKPNSSKKKKQNLLLNQLDTKETNENQIGYKNQTLLDNSSHQPDFPFHSSEGKGAKGTKDKIERIFSTIRLSNKKKSKHEQKEALSQKLEKLRNMVFNQQDKK